MKVPLLLIVLLYCQHLFAQQVGFSTLKLESLPLNEFVASAEQNLFDSKLQNVLLKNNISNGAVTQFLVIPKINIYDKTVVEGMQKMNVVKFNLNLLLVNRSNEEIFSSQSFLLSGSGTSDKEAFRNALSKLKTNDQQFKTFFKEANITVHQYYQKNCEKLSVEAKKLEDSRDFIGSLIILSSIPVGTDCYVMAVAKLQIVYDKFQEQSCNYNLQQAKINVAGGNYQLALIYLSQIDRSASCIKEADALLAQLGLKVDEENKKEWELIMKRQESNVEANKIRADILNKILERNYQINN